MVQSRDQSEPQWEHTAARLQRSQQAQSHIGHAKPDCPLHQPREASSLSVIYRVRHTVSWLLPPNACLRRSSSIRVAPSHPSSARAITAMFCNTRPIRETAARRTILPACESFKSAAAAGRKQLPFPISAKHNEGDHLWGRRYYKRAALQSSERCPEPPRPRSPTATWCTKWVRFVIVAACTSAPLHYNMYATRAMFLTALP